MAKLVSLVVAVSTGMVGGLYIAQNYEVPKVVAVAQSIKT